ncbi:MAG TPA: Crp/Fnr family transcriptional regulator [Myxococcaceae bacterium]|nr:Crp/Fnr family transcriptional regulator [Myxococcaceae bacterium]
MVSGDNRVASASAVETGGLLLAREESAIPQALVSSGLATIFRGKFCEAILRNRKATTFRKNEILYDVGDKDGRFFFLQSGFVKLGTVTRDGHEITYDVRKSGDVVGELCAYELTRPDRAVALEQTDAVPVPFLEVMEVLRHQPQLLVQLIDVFCRALNEAYVQIVALAIDDTLHRLAKVLLKLATSIGKQSGLWAEIPTYLTQEEIAQMVAARRERVSTGLNFLRRQGLIQYSNHGHLMLQVKGLADYSSR